MSWSGISKRHATDSNGKDSHISCSCSHLFVYHYVIETWLLYCCSDDEESTAVNAVKLQPSVGRGMKLPPICDVKLPKAYYDELPSHIHMLSKSGLGRGQQLQELVGKNRDLENVGQGSFPMSELPVCSDRPPTRP